MPRSPRQEDPTLRKRSPRDGEDKAARSKVEPVPEGDSYVDPLMLARGGEVLLRRMNDINSANSELRRQLELQVKEVSTLQEAGQSQNDLLRQFERQAEQARVAETANIEARVRAEIGQREVQLQEELDLANEQARLDREEFQQRFHQMDGEFRHIEGERDEARERIRELEGRLEGHANAPDAQAERMKGLEMELSLVRARFARETEAKKAAERASAESRAQQQDMKTHLEREVSHVKQLDKALAEQTELANFRQEICNDLQLRLADQKGEAEKNLRREKGKFEAVSRLEGILPRHMVMKALA